MNKPLTWFGDWFDKKHNQKKLWWVLWIICGLTLVPQIIQAIGGHMPHGHFGAFDSWPGFSAVLGFLACAVSIIVAKGLGKFLKVREDFYNDDAP